MDSINFNRVVTLSGNMTMNIRNGRLARLNLNPNDVVEIEIKVIKRSED